jgi:cytochrome c
MFRTIVKATVAFSVIGTAGLAYAEGDAANGEKLFRRCQACHVIDKEQNRVGPHLVGIIGREVASVDSYSYSDAMNEWAADKGEWTTDLMFSYLEQPMQTVKGTKMAFPGLKDPQDRRDLIAYLEQAD